MRDTSIKNPWSNSQRRRGKNSAGGWFRKDEQILPSPKTAVIRNKCLFPIKLHLQKSVQAAGSAAVTAVGPEDVPAGGQALLTKLQHWPKNHKEHGRDLEPLQSKM